MKYRNPAKTVADLPAGVVVKLMQDASEIRATLVRRASAGWEPLRTKYGMAVGIYAYKAWWQRGKRNPFIVRLAEAPKGFGPLLYDVVMEAAGASGLTSDRSEVSDDARAVWQHYMDRRPDVRSEITKVDHEPGLDPRYSERAFGLSPLARAYFATGTPTIDALRRAGKLVVEGEAAPLAAVANPAAQTDTAAFKKWFGKSKVVDSKGKPLVVYHGTKKGGFTVFKPQDEYFFTDNEAVAQTYGLVIYPAFLSISNPLVIDGKGAPWNRILLQGEYVNTKYVSRLAKDAGHDGAILRNIYDSDVGVGGAVSTVFIAFKPEQIKSANHNRGTFDPTDPDIRHNPSPRTFIPPKAVADQARMGLALRESLPPSQRCCTTVGIRRAVQLANRQPVSVSTLKRMRSYFQRHAVDSRGVGWRETSKGWQAWLAWGSDAGRKWCNEILDKLGE